MKSARSLALAFVALGGGAWVACSFPSVTYTNDAVDATTDVGDVDAEADVVEEPPPPDFPDAALDALNPCDIDNDGYRAIGCEGDGGDGGDGGSDCNDHDKRVNPGVTAFLSDVPSGPPSGDWNCRNGVEYQYPTINCGGFLAVACKGEGYVKNPGCGVSGSYVMCQWNLGTLSCESIPQGPRTQGCR